MENLQLKLITLYAEHDTTDLDKADAGPLFVKALNKSMLELIDDMQFKKNKELIRSIKTELETFRNESASNKETITKCLEYIWALSTTEGAYDQIKFQEKGEMIIMLTKETFKNHWTLQQSQYFDELANSFVSNNHFFLSYTNHYPTSINSKFINIYERIFDKNEIGPEDMVKRNLLAKAMVKQLHRRNMKRGFFDDFSLRQGTHLQNIITQAQQSIALIQLVSKGSFEYTTPNWSLEEFKAYKNARTVNNIMMFFVIQENAIPEIIHPDYRIWKKTLDQTLHKNEFYSVVDLENFEKVIDKLISDIIYMNKEIISRIPH